MSQETIEAFWRDTAAYNRGDWEAALASMDPNVEFDLTRVAPDGETYRGYEGVKVFWRMLWDVFGELRIEPEEVIDGGDTLVTHERLRSTGKASGVMTEDVLYQDFALRDGKVIRVQFFRDRAEALKAAGLSEQDAHADP
jgi:ketosteroid isomerase-like protein